MRPDPAVYLWDAERAAGYVLDFSAGRTFADLSEDLLFRSAAERQLQKMGQALAQLTRTFPEIAAKIPAVDEIVGLRSDLVHNYYRLNYATVWKTITEDVPGVRAHLQALLREVTE